MHKLGVALPTVYRVASAITMADVMREEKIRV